MNCFRYAQQNSRTRLACIKHVPKICLTQLIQQHNSNLGILRVPKKQTCVLVYIYIYIFEPVTHVIDACRTTSKLETHTSNNRESNTNSTLPRECWGLGHLDHGKFVVFVCFEFSRVFPVLVLRRCGSSTLFQHVCLLVFRCDPARTGLCQSPSLTAFLSGK